jgi:hypothetical protein
VNRPVAAIALGFVSALAVALAAALWSRPFTESALASVAPATYHAGWPKGTPPDWYGVPVTGQGVVRTRSSFGVDWRLQAGVLDDGKSVVAEEFQAGWPLRCLRAVRWSSHTPPFYSARRERISAFLMPSRMQRFLHTDLPWLPSRPMIGRCAVNVGCFSAAWWSLLLVLGWLRRCVRHSRGLCHRCGYSLAGLTSDICPECGTSKARARLTMPWGR